MSNVFANLAVGAGAQAGTSVTTMAEEKTIMVTGLTGGVMHIESSVDGTTWDPVVDFTSSGVQTVQLNCVSMRTRGSGVTGSANCDVSAELSTVRTVTPAIPAGDGTAAASACTTLGNEKTILVTGTFVGNVIIEASLDGTNYSEVAFFDAAGSLELEQVWSNVRVKRSGTVSGTPVVTIAASSVVEVGPPMSSPIDASGLGLTVSQYVNVPAGAGGAADDITVFNAAVPYGMRLLDTVFVCLTAVGGSTVTLRTAAAGAGSALSDALSTATTGYKRDTTLTAAPTVAAASSIFLRRSDSAIAGQLILTFMRT